MSKKKLYERPVIQRLNVGLMNKFGSKPELQSLNEIDGNKVDDLLKKFGSPLFVISERSLRDTFKDASRAFKTRYPKVQFAW